MEEENKDLIKESKEENNEIKAEEKITRRKNNKSNNEINIGLLVIIIIIVSIASGFAGATIVLRSTEDNTSTSNGITTSNIKLNETNSISNAVNKVYDAVVVVEGYSNDKLSSTGTGFVYKKKDNKAYIMTNNHVVAKCDKVKVLFTNGDELETTLVGADTYSDIAVLTVKDSDKIISATMGESSKSKVGDTVFTVGSPEGSDYAGTVTKGILSGKDRLVEVALSNSNTSDYYMKVMQTDAAINPGNSGGPICNINGEVIGITNMKLVDNSVEGMGFAIPIEDALYYAAMLEKGNDVIRPYFGIGMLDIGDSYYLWQNGITIPKDVTSGVVISEVANNSPASRAGLKKGDIIISLAGEDIKSLAEFRYQLYRCKVGEKIVVKYIRDGKKQEVKVKLTKNDNK